MTGAFMATPLSGLMCRSCARRSSRRARFCICRYFLPPELTAQLVSAVRTLEHSVNRNYLPGHKQGGSVSRHTIDARAPLIASSLSLAGTDSAGWGSSRAKNCRYRRRDDPHAYALYFYTEPGDHIGWHYDTSYYAGAATRC